MVAGVVKRVFLFIMVLMGMSFLLVLCSAAYAADTIYFLKDHGPEVVIVNNHGEECAVIDMQDGTISVYSTTKKIKVRAYLDKNLEYAHSDHTLRGEVVELQMPGGKGKK